MNRRRATLLPIAVLGGSFLLGGFFLQEGVTRDQNVYVQVRVFQEVLDRISSDFIDEVGEDALYQNAIQGLIERLDDPNTSFIPASRYQDFSIQATEGRYGGVGLEVIQRNGLVTIVAPIPGTPGDRAGIRTGDWFVEVDGQDAEGLTVDEAVDILRGRPGSEVEVLIGRPGVADPIPFTLERADIKLASVPFSTILDGDVGYVPLQAFRDEVTEELQAALEDLVASGARSLVLDLRDNPGGLLTDGVGISELFLDRGDPIAETRGRAIGSDETFVSNTADAYPDLPMVVLVNEGSASASEIVAGALQDHDRALVIGAPSYGKGSVQTVYRLTGGNAFRQTTALWYTPVGRSVEKERSDSVELPRGALTLDADVARVPAEADKERPTFTSMGGRSIVGGGGITPDVWIVPDTMTTVESRAADALALRGNAFVTAVFNVAVDHVATRPDLPRDFRLETDVVEALRTRLKEQGVTAPGAEALGITEDALLADADRFLRHRLEREIALQAFGEEGEFLRMHDRDRQLQAALERLRGASSPRALVALPE
jgi:carboxyl-terminal processing protease